MRGLFDWDFKTFLTPKLIQAFYIFAVIFGALAVVVADVIVLATLNHHYSLPWQDPRGLDSSVFGAVLFSPVLYAIGIVVLRVMLECMIVFFTMAEALTRRP